MQACTSSYFRRLYIDTPPGTGARSPPTHQVTRERSACPGPRCHQSTWGRRRHGHHISPAGAAGDGRAGRAADATAAGAAAAAPWASPERPRGGPGPTAPYRHRPDRLVPMARHGKPGEVHQRQLLGPGLHGQCVLRGHRGERVLRWQRRLQPGVDRGAADAGRRLRLRRVRPDLGIHAGLEHDLRTHQCGPGPDTMFSRGAASPSG